MQRLERKSLSWVESELGSELLQVSDPDNSCLFDVHRWSEYPEVKAATDAMYEELKSSGLLVGKGNIQRTHIRVVLLNLYPAYLADPTRYVAYYRMKAAYKAKSRYNALHISFLTVAVVNALRQLGYVDHVKGFYDRRPGGRSRTSRMRATAWSTSGASGPPRSSALRRAIAIRVS